MPDRATPNLPPFEAGILVAGQAAQLIGRVVDFVHSAGQILETYHARQRGQSQAKHVQSPYR